MYPASAAVIPGMEGALGGLGGGILGGGAAAIPAGFGPMSVGAEAMIPGLEAVPSAIPAFSYAPAAAGTMASSGGSMFDTLGGLASQAGQWGMGQAQKGVESSVQKAIERTLFPGETPGAPGEKGAPASMAPMQGVGSFKPQEKAAQIMGQQAPSSNPLSALPTDLRHQILAAMLQGIR